jgi:hypothetical protein
MKITLNVVALRVMYRSYCSIKCPRKKMLFSKEKSKYNIPSFSILDEHIIRLKQLSNTFGLSSYSLIRSKMKAILSDAICMIET